MQDSPRLLGAVRSIDEKRQMELKWQLSVLVMALFNHVYTSLGGSYTQEHNGGLDRKAMTLVIAYHKSWGVCCLEELKTTHSQALRPRAIKGRTSRAKSNSAWARPDRSFKLN